MALIKRGGGVTFEAPSEIDLFPENQHFVRNHVEVQGVRNVGIDGVGRAIHAHGSIFGGELHLVEHGDAEGEGNHHKE